MVLSLVLSLLLVVVRSVLFALLLLVVVKIVVIVVIVVVVIIIIIISSRTRYVGADHPIYDFKPPPDPQILIPTSPRKLLGFLSK